MDGETPTSEPPPDKLVRTFNCPQCGAAVTIRASGQSLVATCSGCQSIIDVRDPNYRILSRFFANQKFKPLIPIGGRGKLFDVEYEIIGFMVRSSSENYEWQEYLLFNPYHGFRWLTMDHGHWNFITMVKDPPRTSSRHKVTWKGRQFDIYMRGQAVVNYVFGEFYWKVKVGDKVEVTDYICPPEILSQERSKGEVVWSHGLYVEPTVMRKAFQLQMEPLRTSVAPNQPSPYQIGHLNLIMSFALLALISIEILAGITSKHEAVWGTDMTYLSTDASKVKVTQKFELKQDLADVMVQVSSPVENNWIDLDIGLINAQTESAVYVTAGVEYYHGADSDGAWSEGSRVRKVLISSIPGGTYYLTVEPTADPAIKTIPYRVRIDRDVLPWSNFWIVILPVLIFPLIAWWRKHSFEVNRWAESDFSPYDSND